MPKEVIVSCMTQILLKIIYAILINQHGSFKALTRPKPLHVGQTFALASGG